MPLVPKLRAYLSKIISCKVLPGTSLFTEGTATPPVEGARPLPTALSPSLPLFSNKEASIPMNLLARRRDFFLLHTGMLRCSLALLLHDATVNTCSSWA